MGYAFKAFFAFLTGLFSAAEKSASALNNLATWADEATGTFADKSRFEREQDLQALYKAAGITAFPSAPVKAKVAAPKAAP